MDDFVARKDDLGSLGFNWFSKDDVAVIVVKYKEIVVALAGRCDEAICLVSVDLAGRFEGGGVAVVDTLVSAGGGGERISVGFGVRLGWW